MGFQREEGRILVVPEEVVVGIEEDLPGEVEVQTCSVVVGDEWVAPAG